MSKATGPGGGFLVPQDFDVMVTSARRAANVIGAAAREIVTLKAGRSPFRSTRRTGRGRGRLRTRPSPLRTRRSRRPLSARTRPRPNNRERGARRGRARGLRPLPRRRARPARGRARGGRLRAGRRRREAHGAVNATNGVATVAAATGAATTFKLADFRAAFAALPPAYAGSRPGSRRPRRCARLRRQPGARERSRPAAKRAPAGSRAGSESGERPRCPCRPRRSRKALGDMIQVAFGRPARARLGRPSSVGAPLGFGAGRPARLRACGRSRRPRGRVARPHKLGDVEG